MAKKQEFVVGSTNPVTTTDMTTNQLNMAWDRLDVLNAEELNGVLYAISQQSKMNSDEIAAALEAYGITLDPTKSNQMAALMEEVNRRIAEAATSGKNIGSYWFGKTQASTSVPAPTVAGQNYIDFTTMNTYESTNGTTWTQTGTLDYDKTIDCFVLITSKFWDISEQSGQQGGEAQWSSTTQSWAYWPKIVDFYNANLTGTPTTTSLTSSSPNNQVANKEYVDNIAAGKIDSDTAVLLTGDQTVAGTKTFSSVPVISTSPTATSSTSATQAATTGWVNDSTKATNVLHRDTPETITADKTLTAGDVRIIKSASYDITEIPASVQYTEGVIFGDANRVTSGVLGQSLEPDGVLGSFLDVRRGDHSAAISVYLAADGTRWAGAPTPPASTETTNTNIVTVGWANTYLARPSLLPPGSIVPFAGNEVPTGFLVCNGQAVSRTTYAALFAAIGTIYGSGDGSTTFNLPDLRDRLPMMGYLSADPVGTLSEGRLPNITGGWQTSSEQATTSGAIYNESNFAQRGWDGRATIGRNYRIDASRSSSIYNSSNAYVTARNVITLYVIKY